MGRVEVEGGGRTLPCWGQPGWTVFVLVLTRLEGWVIWCAKYFKHLHHIVQPVVSEFVEHEADEGDNSHNRQDELRVLLHIFEVRLLWSSPACQVVLSLKKRIRIS